MVDKVIWKLTTGPDTKRYAIVNGHFIPIPDYIVEIVNEGADVSNPERIETGDYEFTRDDAIRLCAAWQRFAHTKTSGSWAGDAVEVSIEELCLAWGFTIDDVRATWASRKQER